MYVLSRYYEATPSINAERITEPNEDEKGTRFSLASVFYCTNKEIFTKLLSENFTSIVELESLYRETRTKLIRKHKKAMKI